MTKRTKPSNLKMSSGEDLQLTSIGLVRRVRWTPMDVIDIGGFRRIPRQAEDSILLNGNDVNAFEQAFLTVRL
jgi:hypothetical protein